MTTKILYRFICKLWHNSRLRFTLMTLFAFVVGPAVGHYFVQHGGGWPELETSPWAVVWLSKWLVGVLLSVLFLSVGHIIFTMLCFAYEALLDLVDGIKKDWTESKNEVQAWEQEELRDDHHKNADKKLPN